MSKLQKIAVVSTLVATIAAALPSFAQENCDATIDHYALGNEQYAAGEWASALQSFNCVVTLDPESAAAYNAIGNVRRQLGEYQQAIEAYSRAIELQPNLAVAYNNRGWSYYNLTEYDKAFADYNQAISLDANLAFAYNNRGLIYQLQGDVTSAAADFERAIELNIPVSWAEYNLRLLGADEEVTTTPETAVVPGVDEVMTAATSAYNSRQFAEAVEHYTEVIELDPNNSNAFYYRGRSYIALDQFEEAAADFDRLVELRPTFTYAYWERAVAYAELGDFEQANADAERASAAISDHVNNFITYGTIAALMGDEAEAGRQFAALMEAWGGERIELGSTAYGRPVDVNMVAGAVMEIHFEGNEGDVVTMTASSTEADPVIVLLGPDNQPLAGDDDSGNSIDSLISEFELPEDGTYTLLVSHAGGGSYGSIRVSLSAS